MAALPRPIPEWQGVDAATFARDVATRYNPAVLRGAVADWPAVGRALESGESFCRYLESLDSGAAVDVLRVPPHARGRIFYNDDMTGFNFARDKATISAVTEKLVRYARFENRPAIAVQSAPIAECLPGFAAENRLALLDASVAPRIWLGTAVTVAAHFDESSNIACVVSGRRRFTLFPPEQIANLYIGPLDFAPTGTPMSLVRLAAPDFERFPRFREALAAAQVAELGPGDAIYIPSLWWHHVESLEKVNALVNYWWKGPPGAAVNADSALDCLLLAVLRLRQLPPDQRRAWASIFDHYVFNAANDDAGHIPEHRRGILGAMSPEYMRQVKAFVASQLQKASRST
jgi:hypothetical protein